MEDYDVFISYHWPDHAKAEEMARILREKHRLRPFLDRWYLVPGQPWPQALEKVLKHCKAAAVLVGPHGMGSWQQRELNFVIDRQVHDPGFPVIPVLLPDAEPILGFLSQNTWVDLRQRPDDPFLMDVLAAAIRGEPPGQELQQHVSDTLLKVCPYRGLLYFREEDAAFFFGRDAAIKQLAEAVSKKSFVAVVGASGCGKSSVVRAGLVPALRRDKNRVWEIVTMVPGDRPLHALASAMIPLLEPEMTETDRLIELNKLAKGLAAGDLSLRDIAARVISKQPGTDRLLIVADQWEDLYTITQDEVAGRRVIDELLDVSMSETGRASVVLTLRGDFVGKTLAYRPLCDRLQDAQVNLGPMTHQELKDAVTLPADKVGFEFEPGLIKRILDDVGDTPGNLPLLEFVLKRLWEDRKGRLLHHNAYDAMDGLQGAVAAKAEEVFNKLSKDEKAEAHRIFIQMVHPGEQGEDTRRRVRLKEIIKTAHKVVETLAEERLLVMAASGLGEDTTVEVAHEALIRHWDRLKTWLDVDREFLLWRDRVQIKISEWQRVKTDPDALLRGRFLDEALQWLNQRREQMTEEECEYVEKSSSKAKITHYKNIGKWFMIIFSLVVLFWMVFKQKDLIGKNFIELANQINFLK